jgi:EAL domain-containing protein (putative c-di-GMP-specific phosphodiesterase class I)/CheY-like chemotaxis protein/HPt (histidine-containing phosphotransfer) domain-containing protein
MDGKIDVFSTVGVGSKFRVRIPSGDTTGRPWPTLGNTSSEQPVCILDVSGEATASALAAYLGAFGYSVRRAGAGTSSAEYRSGVIVFADAARLDQLSLGGRAGRIPNVVAVTPFGDAVADDLIATGAADAAISRPLLRSEIEELLSRIAAGDKQLHSRASGRRRDGALPRFARLKVLVADDSAVNREVAIEALSRLGAQVETVENGAQAVSAAARRAHDIILMDGSMPEIDGFNAARMIRQAEEKENRARVPIIALTAHVVGVAATEWQRAGMDAVIHKPFTIAQLAQCLLEQVPQFQTAIGERTADGLDGSPERDAPSEASNAEGSVGEGSVDVRLVDPAVLDELRTLNEAKKGDFLKRVVDLYSEHAPKACAQLREHARAGDAAACGSVAHSLKSMSLNIGAIAVAKIAAGFEQMARGEGKVPGHEALTQLSHALKETLAVLGAETGGQHVAPSVAESGQPAAHTDAPIVIMAADGLEKDLYSAIERGELDVEYQPFVDRAGRQVLGVEALVRWRKDGDNIPPSTFVPIAERTGFIEEIGKWVLRRACADALAWPRLTVAVNISPIQFRRPELADEVERILSESAIEPDRVELEITETAMLDAEVAVLNTIDQLHRLGVTFALDDFGTGYSSLTSLRRFQIDKIKIDRSFVANIGLAIDATIVHAIVSIGRALGLKVVAEGVETVEQQKFVTAAGVHAMQGYLFARPMKDTNVPRFIAELDDRFRPSTLAVS